MLVSTLPVPGSIASRALVSGLIAKRPLPSALNTTSLKGTGVSIIASRAQEFAVSKMWISSAVSVVCTSSVEAQLTITLPTNKRRRTANPGRRPTCHLRRGSFPIHPPVLLALGFAEGIGIAPLMILARIRSNTYEPVCFARLMTAGQAQTDVGIRGGALRDSYFEMRSSCRRVRPMSSQPLRRQRRRKGSTWKS